MTKAELITAVAEELDVTKSETKHYVDVAFEKMFKALANGEDVSIAGFGAFKVKETAAKTARNPQTGEAVDVPAAHKVSFKPTMALKDAVKAL